MSRGGAGRKPGLIRIGSATAFGYLLGTIPSADVAARLAGGDHDLRKEGTGNPGAANTAALLGPKWGASVLAADMGKGAVAGFAGRTIGGDTGGFAAATASVGGHVFPVWNKGRGGKGVATSAGATLAVFPTYFPIDLAVTLIGALRHRRAEAITKVACAGFVVASVAAWRWRLPNAWGPEPSAALVVFAAGTSTMILAAFSRGRSTEDAAP